MWNHLQCFYPFILAVPVRYSLGFIHWLELETFPKDHREKAVKSGERFEKRTSGGASNLVTERSLAVQTHCESNVISGRHFFSPR